MRRLQTADLHLGTGLRTVDLAAAADAGQKAGWGRDAPRALSLCTSLSLYSEQEQEREWKQGGTYIYSSVRAGHTYRAPTQIRGSYRIHIQDWTQNATDISSAS